MENQNSMKIIFQNLKRLNGMDTKISMKIILTDLKDQMGLER